MVSMRWGKECRPRSRGAGRVNVLPARAAAAAACLRVRTSGEVLYSGGKLSSVLPCPLAELPLLPLGIRGACAPSRTLAPLPRSG